MDTRMGGPVTRGNVVGHIGVTRGIDMKERNISAKAVPSEDLKYHCGPDQVPHGRTILKTLRLQALLVVLPASVVFQTTC